MRRLARTPLFALLAGLILIAASASTALARSRSVTDRAAGGRWLRIRVYEHGSSTPSVLVNLPLKLVSEVVHLATTGRDAHVKGTIEVDDLDALGKEIEAMEPGQILEIEDGGGRVSIGIE
ncbi:MAG TPA: hypothetical protein VFT43_01390, partial [Candidatus Polarisedimenticolia bacterium]|nr:hypothetical protein [Candidatus Polarisedimenticolia bacterium]